jgi:hypothetical protein
MYIEPNYLELPSFSFAINCRRFEWVWKIIFQWEDSIRYMYVLKWQMITDIVDSQ